MAKRLRPQGLQALGQAMMLGLSGLSVFFDVHGFELAGVQIVLAFLQRTSMLVTCSCAAAVVRLALHKGFFLLLHDGFQLADLAAIGQQAGAVEKAADNHPLRRPPLRHRG